MKRTLLICSLCLLLGGSEVAFAQSASQEELRELITSSAAATKSLECVFTQVRKSSVMAQDLVSEGKMQFQSPDKLLWEYTSPNKLSLGIDGNSVAITRDGVALDSSDGASRMYTLISRFLIGSVSGSLFTDEKLFKCSFSEAPDGRITAVLIPRKGELKRMFCRIQMHFDPGSLTATDLTLEEESGDSTLITFTGVKKN